MSFADTFKALSDPVRQGDTCNVKKWKAVGRRDCG